MTKGKIVSGVGVDLGTMNIVSARMTSEGKVATQRIRDAFLDLDVDAKKQLRLSKIDFVEMGDQIVVLGDAALTMANLFKREVRRPLSQGIIAAGELKAQQVLSVLIKSVLGKPATDNEHCFYCVPAAPIDVQGQDVLYHQEIFRKIIEEQGYTPHAMNEAVAIIYSQCADSNFSGLSISFGSGMVNVALAYQTVVGMEFSLARGGDWIDHHAANARGTTSSRMCAIKEKGVNLLKPQGPDHEAIALYVRALIKYALENVAAQFKRVQTSIDLPEPIPFVVSGGTTRAEGFMEVFEEEFQGIKKRGFPIEISAVRPATDPMSAVAEGLLVLAMEEHAE